jgi:aminopeptidase N
MRELVVAHEVAHQWWHGLVGSDSRAHPYVDESLAQWSALLYLEERYGAARAREDADMQVKMGYQMMRVMGHPDGAVDRPADAFGHPIVYAGLVYGKGPYMYPALRRAVGDRTFFAALRRYVDTYRFRQATSRGFVDQLARGRHRQRVRAIARRWLEGTHGDSDLGQLDLGPLRGMLGGGLPGLGGARGLPGAGGGAGAGAGTGGAAGAGGAIDVDALRRAIEGL